MTDAHLTGPEIDRHQQGEPLPADRARHAETCPRCHALVSGHGELWDLLGGAIPTPEGDTWPAIADALDRNRIRHRYTKRVALAAAAALALVASVWSAGLTSRGQDTPPMAAPDETFAASRPAAERLADVLELGSRTALGEPWQPLLVVLERDPDEHVRIAALDGLQEAAAAGAVPQERLLDVLRRERSPLLQADLIDILLGRGGDAAIPLLQDALPADNIHPFVRRKLAERT